MGRAGCSEEEDHFLPAPEGLGGRSDNGGRNGAVHPEEGVAGVTDHPEVGYPPGLCGGVTIFPVASVWEGL